MRHALAVLLLLLPLFPPMHVRVHATKGTVKRPVALLAEVSGQLSSAVLSFDWDFGDGTVLTTPKHAGLHQYTRPGVYQVTVVVTDTAHQNWAPAPSEPIHAIVTEQ